MSPRLRIGYNLSLNDIIKLFPGMSRAEIALSRTTLFFQGFQRTRAQIAFLLCYYKFFPGRKPLGLRSFAYSQWEWSTVLWRFSRLHDNTMEESHMGKGDFFSFSLSPILNSFLPTSWCVHIQRIISNPVHFPALASVTSPEILTATQNWKQAV